MRNAARGALAAAVVTAFWLAAYLSWAAYLGPVQDERLRLAREILEVPARIPRMVLVAAACGAPLGWIAGRVPGGAWPRRLGVLGATLAATWTFDLVMIIAGTPSDAPSDDVFITYALSPALAAWMITWPGILSATLATALLVEAVTRPRAGLGTGRVAGPLVGIAVVAGAMFVMGTHLLSATHGRTAPFVRPRFEVKVDFFDVPQSACRGDVRVEGDHEVNLFRQGVREVNLDVPNTDPPTVLTLTAVPSEGCTFRGWGPFLEAEGSPCTGTGPCVLAVTRNLRFVARFVPAEAGR